MSDELTFADLDSLAPAEVPFGYGGRKYVLCEASGEAAGAWKAAIFRAHKAGPDGKMHPTEAMVDTEPLLVSRCLYNADADGKVPLDKQGQRDGKALVNIQAVKALPNRVQRLLFDQAQKISRLGPYEEDLPKMKALRDFLNERIAEMESVAAEDGPKNLARAGTPG